MHEVESKGVAVPPNCLDCGEPHGYAFAMVNVLVKKGRKKLTRFHGPVCGSCAEKRRAEYARQLKEVKT